MEPDNKTKHKQKNYQASVHKSHILFTAPHSKNLKRGKPEQHIDDHPREAITSFLAVDFAKETGQNSFVIWKATEQINQSDLDPNYLLAQQLEISPFHQSLHYWALSSPKTPLFHIDIHGKQNRSYDCHIDIGMMSMDVHFEKDPLANEIRSFFKKHGDIFNGYQFGPFKCQFNTTPILHGYWGGHIHTMTQQAILLGIPSMQVEIPYDVRIVMFKDKVLRGRFHSLIKKLYQTVIVPDYKRKERKYKASKQIGSRFEPNITNKKVQLLSQEIVNYQKSVKVTHY